MVRSMGTSGTTTVPATADYRERIAGTWADGDPLIYAFPGDGMPIVAAVDGELRYLSYHLVRPRIVDAADVEKFAAARGEPTVMHLSEHPAGYEPRLLRMRPY